MNNSDAQIIESVICGNADDYAVIVNRYSDRVFALVARIVNLREDAEELAQDVFMKAFTSLKSYKGDCAFSTWLYRIAYNTAISAVRAKHYDTVNIDDVLMSSISDTMIDDVLNDDSEQRIHNLQTALTKLDPDERAIIVLFYFDDKSMNEVAEIMQLTVANVKVRIHRIRKKLYLLITEEEKR